MILPVDKGKATVVLHKDDYKTKVKLMLSDSRTYEVLKKDPTPTRQHFIQAKARRNNQQSTI